MEVSKLRVYRQCLQAFQMVEDIAKDLPPELFDTKRQILRSSKAIAPIIAEGFGRKRSQREFYKYVIDAMSSSDETITHLRTIAMSKFNTIPIEKLKKTAEVYKSISRQLNKLSSTIKSKLVI
ncbi:hypothetical protein A2470_03440 [Candidatus Curtissbacteria bacterium RIFOXYC2_FULL_41_11]|nr:MAG: hypothetical protein A2470_03440 [Candidatus Curtissbacteria bacterium RIFOXYC2_FULL_41_11]